MSDTKNKENVSVNASMRFKSVNDLLSKARTEPLTGGPTEVAESICSLCEYADTALDNCEEKKEDEDLKAIVMNLAKSQEVLLKESTELKAKLQHAMEAGTNKVEPVSTPVQEQSKRNDILSTNCVIKSLSFTPSEGDTQRTKQEKMQLCSEIEAVENNSLFNSNIKVDKKDMSLHELLEIRSSLLKSIDFANTLVDLKLSQKEMNFHERKDREIAQSARDYSHLLLSQPKLPREEPETERPKVVEKGRKDSLKEYIREKFTIMMKRAAQRSNAARSKIREQIALLRASQKPPAVKLEDPPLVPPSIPAKSKAKVRYDESLVDLIDSIESERVTNLAEKSERQIFDNPSGVPSKVYYPRHQLYRRSANHIS